MPCSLHMRRNFSPYTQGHWKTWQASQVGRSRLHLIYRSRISMRETGLSWSWTREARSHGLTFLLRQLLQFILSRGSLLSLLAAAETGRRSIPTAGLKAEVAILIVQRQRQQQQRLGLLGASVTRQWPGAGFVGRRDGNSFYVMR